MTECCFLCLAPSQPPCLYCHLVNSCSAHLSTHRPDNNCLPFSIAWLDNVGRMVRAVRDIKAGEIVMTDKAAVSGPGSSSEPVCLDCLSPWNGNNICNSCGWPVCDEGCQVGDCHSIECDTLSRCPSDQRPDFACSDNKINMSLIFPLRLAILSKRDIDLENRIDLLMDHKEEIEKQANFETKWNIPVIKYLTANLNSNLEPNELIRAIGIQCTNAAYMGHRNGRWLFPTFSFLSHSCVANSRFFVSPHGQVVVRAQDNIKAGSEVTISYFPCKQDNVTRKKKTEKLWFFSCSCLRCQDSTELGTYSSAIRCRKCNESSSYILPQIDHTWECQSCHKVVTHETATAIVSLMEEKLKQVNTIEDIEDCINKLDSVIHPNHYLMLELKQKLVNIWNESSTLLELSQLKQLLNHVTDILSITAVLEPGLSITRGENLKILNPALLQMAKKQLANKAIDKQEFLDIVRRVTRNMKMATECFENTDFTVKK